MVSAVYTWFLEAFEWFFGSELFADPFVSGVLEWYVLIIMLVLFTSIFMIPTYWCCKTIYNKIRGL